MGLNPITLNEKEIEKIYKVVKKNQSLINIDKKNVKFVSVLVSPNDEILERIKNLNFDYYQLYDVEPERTEEIKSKYKIKIITAITVSSKDDVIKYKDYSNISDVILLTISESIPNSLLPSKASPDNLIITREKIFFLLFILLSFVSIKTTF